MMRIRLAGFGLALAAAVAMTPGTAPAQAPAGTCDGIKPFGIDVDCVSLTFTQQPPATTQNQEATIAWVAQIDDVVQAAAAATVPTLTDWSQWRDKVCTLQGPGTSSRAIPCDAAPNVTVSGLTPGAYVFTVTATTPELRDTRSLRASGTDATVAPCGDEGVEVQGFYSCLTVSGQVAWTVGAPDPPPAVEAPAPVAAAAPGAAPPQCTSRRTLTMRIRERKGERIRSARITFRGRTIATTRRTSDGRLVARIDFRTLPAGRFSVQIRATLTSGGKRTYTRRYFTCEPKRPPSNNLESPRSL